MKLSRPDSSSDLEAARSIARRLHQRVRGDDAFPESTPIVITAPDASPPPAATPAAGEAPPEVEAPKKDRPEPVRAPVDARGESRPRPSARERRPTQPEPEPPELEPDLPELEPEPPAAELDAPELEPEPPEFEPEPQGLEPEPPELEPEAPPELEVPGLDGPELEAALSEPPDAETAASDHEPALEPGPPPPAAYGADTGEYQPEPPPTPDIGEPELQALGPDEGPAIEDEADGALAGLTNLPGNAPPEPPPPVPDVSPEDLLEDEPGPAPTASDWSDPSALEAEMLGGDDQAAEAEGSQAPDWDQVADSCLALAPAQGAMLVDPGGQVLTSRGDWPEPGPEAIAGRLVSMMEKKLRDAPTRSVSAPLAGQHLTAWRVPGEDGYLTVVFMADAPLKADVRPAIDTTIQAVGS